MAFGNSITGLGASSSPTEALVSSRLWTGNGSSQDIDFGFEPDWLWIKQFEGSPYNTHAITDAVAGYNSQLTTVSNANETTKSNVITGTSSTGVTLGSDSTVNQSGNVYTSVGIQTTNKTEVNTDGQVATNVRALQGISVMEYSTGTTLNRTLGHGMGAQAKCVIFKRYEGTGAGLQDWYVWIPFYQANSFLKLNTTDAVASNSTWFPSAPNNDTTFTVGSTYTTSGINVRYKALCLGDDPDHVKVQTYTGNPYSKSLGFGFNAKFHLVKRIDAASNWVLYTAARTGGSIASYRGLYGNLDNNYWQSASLVGGFSATGFYFANGYNNAEVNAVGGTYLSIAIG